MLFQLEQGTSAILTPSPEPEEDLMMEMPEDTNAVEFQRRSRYIKFCLDVGLNADQARKFWDELVVCKINLNIWIHYQGLFAKVIILKFNPGKVHKQVRFRNDRVCLPYGGGVYSTNGYIKYEVNIYIYEFVCTSLILTGYNQRDLYQ